MKFKVTVETEEGVRVTKTISATSDAILIHGDGIKGLLDRLIEDASLRAFNKLYSYMTSNRDGKLLFRWNQLVSKKKELDSVETGEYVQRTVQVSDIDFLDDILEMAGQIPTKENEIKLALYSLGITNQSRYKDAVKFASDIKDRLDIAEAMVSVYEK